MPFTWHLVQIVEAGFAPTLSAAWLELDVRLPNGMVDEAIMMKAYAATKQQIETRPAKDQPKGVLADLVTELAFELEQERYERKRAR